MYAICSLADFVREKKGRIWRLNNWGLRRLAYKIKKATHANYILMNFEIEARYINGFKTLLDRDERIIRHLIMKQDEAITEDCPPPEFHALRAQQHMDDEYDDEDEEEEQEELDAVNELTLEVMMATMLKVAMNQKLFLLMKLIRISMKTVEERTGNLRRRSIQ
jgi:ribosomal protein S6